MVPAVPRGTRPYLDDADTSSPGLWTQQGTDKQGCCCLPFSFPISLFWTRDLHDICAYLLQGNHCPFSIKDRTFLTYQFVQKGSCLPRWRLSAFVWCFIVMQRGEWKGWPVPPQAQPQMKHHVVLASLSLDLTDKTQFSRSWTGPRPSTSETPIRLSYHHSHFSLAFTFPQENLKFFLCSALSASHLCGNSKTSLALAPTACPSNKLLQQGCVFPCTAHCCPHSPVFSPNECKTALPQALSLSLAVSKLCILTEKCPGFACMQQLHSKETNTGLNANVGLLSVTSPRRSCSRSFLSGVGQANKNVTLGRN